MKVLYIDDVKPHLKYIEKTLGKSDEIELYTLHFNSEESIDEVLEMIESSITMRAPFQVILCDYEMPIQGNVVLEKIAFKVRQLESLHEYGRSIRPVGIIYTAGASQDQVKTSPLSWICGVIYKKGQLSPKQIYAMLIDFCSIGGNESKFAICSHDRNKVQS